MAREDLEPALARVADRLAAAGAALVRSAGALPGLDPGPAVLGADAVGRLGELGRDLHHAVVAALTDRAREAARHADRLAATADLVTGAARGYAAVEESAAARHREGP